MVSVVFAGSGTRFAHAPLRAQGRFPRLCITEFGRDEGLKMPGKANFCLTCPRIRQDVATLQSDRFVEPGDGQAQGFPSGSVTRFIASACLGLSQRISRVSDIASTMEDETPILVM